MQDRKKNLEYAIPMTVNSSTFVSDSTLFIRDFLSTNLTDLQSPTRNGSAWIFTSWPDNTPTYPIVTIMKDGITDVTKLGQQTNATQTDITMKVSVFAKRVVDRDKLTQDIHNNLRGNQLTASGTVPFQMFNFRTISSISIDEDGEDALHREVMRFKYSLILV